MLEPIDLKTIFNI